MGCEFVEVTTHPGARPSHAVWQGKVFRISGAVTVKLRRSRTQLNDFLKETGLRQDNFREQVVGFGRSAAGKASWAARLQQRLDDVNQELQSLREDGKIKLTGKFVTAPKLEKSLNLMSTPMSTPWSAWQKEALHRRMHRILSKMPCLPSNSATVLNTHIIQTRGLLLSKLTELLLA